MIGSLCSDCEDVTMVSRLKSLFVVCLPTSCAQLIARSIEGRRDGVGTCAEIFIFNHRGVDLM